MKKVLVFISDNNKGKFIAKGFSSAFRELSFFVYEKKLYDLNIEEISQIQPDLCFIFWSDITKKDTLIDFCELYDNKSTTFIHCAEIKSDIPSKLYKKQNHLVFSADSTIKKSTYIPAISAKEYKSTFQGYKYNISFAGNPSTTLREEILSSLVLNFGSINIFCRSFDFYKSLDDISSRKLLDEKFIELYRQSYKGYLSTQRELSDVYTASKINIDIESQVPKYINYRSLEIMASGGFLFTPYNESVIKYFDDGKEIETYSNMAELIDKINFYKKNLDIAQVIAANGKKNVLNNCLITDSLKRILKVIYGKDFSSR